jgi:hypothetical protein
MDCFSDGELKTVSYDTVLLVNFMKLPPKMCHMTYLTILLC